VSARQAWDYNSPFLPEHIPGQFMKTFASLPYRGVS
jgi:hypothetical protein